MTKKYKDKLKRKITNWDKINATYQQRNKILIMHKKLLQISKIVKTTM